MKRRQITSTGWAFGIALLLAFAAAPEAFAQCVDLDGDGFTTCQNDCDDSDPLVNPGVPDDDCDGFSDDCDSKIDEDYTTGTSTCGIGACTKTGNVFCRPGGILLDTCVPFDPAPNDATCDGKDDDCDGLVDEDYAPEVSECGIGACGNTGTTTCVDGSVVELCTPFNPAPNDATCNGIDDDCDGAVDENFVSQPTSCGIGNCAKTGKTFCQQGNIVDSCTPGNAAPADTVCNGKDDDCDGLVDEEYQPVPFSCRIGLCTNTVLTQCVDGVQTVDCQPLEPLEADDDCDGIDDDCDGSVDEHYVIPETTCGTGICARTGKLFCISGTQVDSCQPLEPASGDTDCNGQDDDCDGLIDEDFIAEVTSCGIGACGAEGLTTCSPGGVQGDTCVPGSPRSG